MATEKWLCRCAACGLGCIRSAGTSPLFPVNPLGVLGCMIALTNTYAFVMDVR